MRAILFYTLLILGCKKPSGDCIPRLPNNGYSKTVQFYYERSLIDCYSHYFNIELIYLKDTSKKAIFHNIEYSLSKVGIDSVEIMFRYILLSKKDTIKNDGTFLNFSYPVGIRYYKDDNRRRDFIFSDGEIREHNMNSVFDDTLNTAYKQYVFKHYDQINCTEKSLLQKYYPKRNPK